MRRHAGFALLCAWAAVTLVACAVLRSTFTSSHTALKSLTFTASDPDCTRLVSDALAAAAAAPLAGGSGGSGTRTGNSDGRKGPSTAAEALPFPQPGGRDPRYNMRIWLAFASADARAHGLNISDSCNAMHGEAFLRRWAQARGQLCGNTSSRRDNGSGGSGGRGSGGGRSSGGISNGGSGNGSGEGSGNGSGSGDGNIAGGGSGINSRVDCYAYPVKQKGLGCVATNIVVSASAFMGPPVQPGKPGHEAYVPAGAPGSVRMSCKLDPNGGAGDGSATSSGSVISANYNAEMLPYFKGASQTVDETELSALCRGGGGSAGSSSGGTVRHPVMFMSRLDPTNPYHFGQGFMQAFLTLAVIDTTQEDPPFKRGLQVTRW